ncbi:MAG TPA: LysR family transcriptional regulator [Sandaracinaceae bacterium LLY-WYZ-13_1]|nr:LysR family transcriptional regulator [Sandaracinaceae bacterium LLY-WYZ-13_1]
MEHLNFNHLYYFHVVAEHGSVTGAAKALGVTKPTVSAQLRQLEDFLGAELFDRTGGRMRLNDAGRAAFRHTETMFDAGRALLRHFRRAEPDPPQTLRIGVATTVSRMIAAEFFEPLVELEDAFLRVRNDDAHRLAEALHALELDVLLTDAPPSDPDAHGLRTMLLDRSPLVAVVGPSVTDGEGLGELLDRHPVLHHGRHSSLHWRIDAWLQEHGLHPRVEAHLDDVPTMVALVSRGDALAFVPRSAVARAIDEGELREVATLDGLESQVHALYVARDVPAMVERAVALLRRVEM